MNFEIKVSQEVAEKEVSDFLDKKKVFPKRREQLQPAIDAVVEAITLGYLSINEDGSIEQTLVDPIGDMISVKYMARVAPEIMSKKIESLKNDNQSTRILAYQTSYTGLLTAQIQKMESTDRNIADCIALFFL